MDNLVSAFRGWLRKRKMERENLALCRRYPFLIPWNRWTGKQMSYGWEYTELDAMPDGWRKAFGTEMCEEIREALIEDDDLYSWRIVEIKEKYGGLRLYYNGVKKDSRVPDIVEKYELLSMRICIRCGKPAERITTGWILPYCTECCEGRRSVPIDEYYKEEEKIE